MIINNFRSTALVIAFLGTAVSPACVARDNATRLNQALGLEFADQRPWHLKIAITLYDEKGSNPSPGTIEAWRDGKNLRVTYSFGLATVTDLTTGQGKFTTASGVILPYEARTVFQEIWSSEPSRQSLDESVIRAEKKKIAAVTLDCLTLIPPSLSRAPVPFGLYPTYCFDPANDQLRLKYDLGYHVVIFDAMGNFLQHSVATTFRFLNGKTTVADVKISELHSYVPQPDDFTLTAEFKPDAEADKSAITAPIITFVPKPRYPAELKDKQVHSGDVKIGVVFGADDRVHILRIISSPHPDFSLSAIEAANGILFHPASLAGKLIDFETSVTVHFEFGIN